ncbi:MAG: Formate dehydrogenase, partial [Pseudomonadota bacterium]
PISVMNANSIAYGIRITNRKIFGPHATTTNIETRYPINPQTASKRGIRNGDRAWVKSPTGARLNVQALVTERVAPDTVFLPFHFSGRWQGADMLAHYPNGAAPIVRGEAVNTATTYGYDSVTMMQETKTTVCDVEKA